MAGSRRTTTVVAAIPEAMPQRLADTVCVVSLAAGFAIGAVGNALAILPLTRRPIPRQARNRQSVGPDACRARRMWVVGTTRRQEASGHGVVRRGMNWFERIAHGRRAPE